MTEVECSFEVERLDLELIHGFLRPKPSGPAQVGFARTMTDRATSAYLPDVFVIVGFQPIARPERGMEIFRPDVYRSPGGSVAGGV
jgi:hypothetical protein